MNLGFFYKTCKLNTNDYEKVNDFLSILARNDWHLCQ
jgi:hypothetical protein